MDYNINCGLLSSWGSHAMVLDLYGVVRGGTLVGLNGVFVRTFA